MKKSRMLIAALVLMLACVTAWVASADGALWPAEPGGNVKKNGKLRVDVANTAEGYVQVSVKSKTSKKLKLRFKKGKETLTYDLNGKTDYEVFPLQLGDGKYEISLYENIKGKSYSATGKISVSVKLNDPEGCFYYPNQYVNYTPETEAVAKAEELCANKDRKDAYDTVCGFMAGNFVYDYIKAINIKSGMLPEIEETWKKRMGVCQDLSAVMCCMLRTQGFPARLMIGMADNNYHAWVTVNLDGEEQMFDPTVAVSGISSVKKYTVERFY